MSLCLWTIGHSTRPGEEFIRLLKAHDVRRVADVRAIPYSKRNPQYHTATLADDLTEAGLLYRHLPSLGGRRKSRPDSANLGWRNASFRGYADYMQTDSFQQGLEELIDLARERPTAIMCAEAVPWRCHRSLIADALVARGWEVRHILTSAKADPHALTSFAKRIDGRLLYPPEKSSESPSLPY